MVYLQPGDYTLYGLEQETPDALVAAASALIDAFCRRASLGAMTYVERLRFARDGRTLRLSYGPVVAITACSTRLRKMRPGMLQAIPFTQLQADAMAFGLGGSWNTLDPTTVTVAADGPGVISGIDSSMAKAAAQRAKRLRKPRCPWLAGSGSSGDPAF